MKEPAIIFDTRSAFDRGFYVAASSDELAYLGLTKGTACAALMVMLPILSGHRLDRVYRRALFCWDGARKTAKPRKPKPPGFEEAQDYFKHLLPSLLGGSSIVPDDAEGDDAVATAAVAEKPNHCLIVSGDKDLKQLVSARVGYYCLHEKSLVSAQAIMVKYGLKHPSQLAVWLAIVGDKNDGISGVNQWGPKKTSKIFEAVTPEDDLTRVVAKAEQALPADQLDNFYDSLSATLLKTDIPGVPEPKELSPAPLEFIDDEGLDHIRSLYSRFLGDFNAGPTASAFDVDEV